MLETMVALHGNNQVSAHKRIIIHELVKVNSVEDFLNIKTGNVPLGGTGNPARWPMGFSTNIRLSSNT